MRTIYFLTICFFASVSCRHEESVAALKGTERRMNGVEWPGEYKYQPGNEALLLTSFTSLDDFKQVVQVTYEGDTSSTTGLGKKPMVTLAHRSRSSEVKSILKSGISQGDFNKVRNGPLRHKIVLGLRCPYALLQRKELMAIEHLGRRRPPLFGKGDAAFYDLAETMVHHIRDEDRLKMSIADLSEKGYLNTFNHITAQAFMTSIFSERLADFVADVHELYNMPELITGNFTEAQLRDLVNGPVDNYVDMINNEWGQELGKVLREKYSIHQKTVWSPTLLADYLNDIQSYHSWAFQIGFTPFRASDKMVIQFAWKINTVLALE